MSQFRFKNKPLVEKHFCVTEKWNKPAYDKKGAVTAANLRWRLDHVRLRIYHCPFGDHWHLSAEPKRTPQLMDYEEKGKKRWRANQMKHEPEYEEV